MIAGSSFSRSSQRYETPRRTHRHDVDCRRAKRKRNHLVQYEYSTDILDNLIAVRHYTLLDRPDLRPQHGNHRLPQHSSSLDHSSSLPSIRSYYAIPDVSRF